MPLADMIIGHPILLHSPVRWDRLPPRAQARFEWLAHGRELLLVEPPQYLDDLRRPRLDHRTLSRHLTRILPRLPALYQGSERTAWLTVRTLLLQLVGLGGALAHRASAPVHWFCTPVPAPVMLGAFGERVVVYDCTVTAGPPVAGGPHRSADDRWLRSRADVVFDEVVFDDAGTLGDLWRRVEATLADRSRRHDAQRERGVSPFRSSRRASSFCSD